MSFYSALTSNSGLISAIGLAISVVAVLVTWLNLTSINAATVSAALDTKKVPDGQNYLFPGNALGPSKFGAETNEYYLDLVLTNSGPGVAKDIKWEITRSDSEKSASNELPYLGRDSRVIVRGYIQKSWTLEETKRISYSVTVSYKSVLAVRTRKIRLLFDGSGELTNPKPNK